MRPTAAASSTQCTRSVGSEGNSAVPPSRAPTRSRASCRSASVQGLTLVHFSAHNPSHFSHKIHRRYPLIPTDLS